MGDSNTALKFYQQTLSVDPNHALALLNIGNYYFKLNNFKSAADYYNQCLNTIYKNSIKQNSDLLFVLNNIGQCYREQGLLNKAHQSFFNALNNITNESEMYIKPWTLNNVYALSGLLCNWKDFEVIESSLEYEILMINNKNNKNIYNSELFIDPYTISLMTFSQSILDVIVAEMSCDITPIFNYSTKTPRKSIFIFIIQYFFRILLIIVLIVK